MSRPLTGNCSMRARSTTLASVGLVVVTSGVTLPATVTSVAVTPIFSAGLISAIWPTCSINSPFQVSMPGASTVIW